jgi:hypothetical protein
MRATFGLSPMLGKILNVRDEWGRRLKNYPTDPAFKGATPFERT